MNTINSLQCRADEVYVRPETQVYAIENSGVLCGSSGDEGTPAWALDPTEGNTIDVLFQNDF